MTVEAVTDAQVDTAIQVAQFRCEDIEIRKLGSLREYSC